MKMITSKHCDDLFCRILRDGWESLSEQEQSDYNYRVEFDNACSCLYYGEGHEQWEKRAVMNLGQKTAKEIWHKAFEHMSRGF